MKCMKWLSLALAICLLLSGVPALTAEGAPEAQFTCSHSAWPAADESQPDGWGVEYRVPFAFIRTLFPGFAGAPGGVIRANCYKCGDLTRTPHYLAWNPVRSEAPDFHRPRDFGEMILG